MGRTQEQERRKRRGSDGTEDLAEDVELELIQERETQGKGFIYYNKVHFYMISSLHDQMETLNK